MGLFEDPCLKLRGELRKGDREKEGTKARRGVGEYSAHSTCALRSRMSFC